MNLFSFFIFLIPAIACIGSFLYLVRALKHDRLPVALVGLFCMAIGFFLLVLDLVLIAITHGPQYIPTYLLFNRLVNDTGFAGRWVLTVYVFIGTGIIITIYLLVRNLLSKFNKSKTEKR